MLMQERRDRLKERRKKREEAEAEERSEFSAQMHHHTLEAIISNKSGEPILLDFRSATPRLTELINETFTALDHDHDGLLSFPEVLTSLGEHRLAEGKISRIHSLDENEESCPDSAVAGAKTLSQIQEASPSARSHPNYWFRMLVFSGPTSRSVAALLERDDIDPDEIFKIQWDLERWTDFWQSTKVTEQTAISRLSSVSCLACTAMLVI